MPSPFGRGLFYWHNHPPSTLVSTLPVPLAAPKTYSSLQLLFLEAELQKSALSPFFQKNLRCFEIRQNKRRVIYQ